MTIEYACVGKTPYGGRCRTIVTPDNPVCLEHLMPDGQVEPAPKPNRLLLKVFVTEEWANRNMANTPTVVKNAQRVQEIDEQHRRLSEQLGVDHFAYRAKGDTGTPVFGKGGLQFVSLMYLEDELGDNGMFLKDLHVEMREDRPGLATVVLEYSPEHPGRIPPPDLTGRDKLFAGCYGKVDVWVNPPREDGAVVHTVNVRQYIRDKSPALYIAYGEGLWGATPAQV